jgi:ribonuclease J
MAQITPQTELVFAPLGGVGEIGMNLAIYGFGDPRTRKWLIVDCGVSFASEEHLPGVDLILPDIRYLIEQRKHIVGLVLTHGHEDHMGALIDLWPRLNVPIYATPFTAALFEARRASEPGAPKIPVNVVPAGGRFALDPFIIDFINVAHSIPESHALAIRTPLGNVLHTGDWKIDLTPTLGPPTDQARLTALGDEGVLALIGDSTNAIRDGRSPSEAEVAKSLAELIRTAPARVAVTTFASHVGRMRAVADAARAVGREVVLVGRAMERVAQVARETGYLDGVQDFRGMDTYGYLPPDKVLALCTGSQGEPRAALARIAQDEHPEVTLTRGDRVIFSSRAIPGNEKAVARVINGLVTQGVEVITDSSHLVHVSGHPRRAELLDMIGWVRPQMLIPAHGEALHLAEHAKLARKAGVPHGLVCRNGDVVRLAPNGPEIVDQIHSGRLYKDGKLLVDADAPAVGSRRRLSFAGLVTVALALNAKGDLAADRCRGRVDAGDRRRRRRRSLRVAAEAPPPRPRRGRGGRPTRRALGRRPALGQEAGVPRPRAGGVGEAESSRTLWVASMLAIPIASTALWLGPWVAVCLLDGRILTVTSANAAQLQLPQRLLDNAWITIQQREQHAGRSFGRAASLFPIA